MVSRDDNELHLNGAAVVGRADFWAVGGYDERLQAYGYDDEDLYARLAGRGLARLNVSYDAIWHVPHGNERRSALPFPRARIDYHALLLEGLPRWGGNTRGLPRVRLAVVHAAYGLGNRLRAVGSAAAYAAATGRELVVVWVPDEHLDAPMGDLDYAAWDGAWAAWRFFNYMVDAPDGAGGGKDLPIAVPPTAHLYWQSAYVMVTDAGLTNWTAANAALRSLPPHPAVAAAVAGVAGRVAVGRLGGAHVRCLNLTADIPAIANATAEYGAAGAAALAHWRGKSGPAVFAAEVVARLRRSSGGGGTPPPLDGFYVASDWGGTAAVVRAAVAAASPPLVAAGVPTADVAAFERTLLRRYKAYVVRVEGDRFCVRRDAFADYIVDVYLDALDGKLRT
ncbi:hypothetical protein I4F81_010916 [Pyropia yezoensis]|uniref:Uncharacterized protein n=1 Tax=Pyropia yezoensis TaxID=2788 RepID=A0ACC3CF26_PYRYE|nr:hypothetical protein I4F81_010916 [Neopyropia yezoensis]